MIYSDRIDFSEGIDLKKQMRQRGAIFITIGIS